MFRNRVCCSVGGAYHCMNLTRSEGRLSLTRQHLQGVIFPHTFTVLQFLHSHFLFCFLSAFPSCWCLNSSASPQCSSAIDLIRHRLTKGSQRYKGLGQAFLPELHQPLPYLHLSSNFPSVLLRKIMQANSNERPYIIKS